MLQFSSSVTYSGCWPFTVPNACSSFVIAHLITILFMEHMFNNHCVDFIGACIVETRCPVKGLFIIYNFGVNSL